MSEFYTCLAILVFVALIISICIIFDKLQDVLFSLDKKVSHIESLIKIMQENQK